MRLVSIVFTFFISFNVFALNGLEFTDCMVRSMNETLKEFEQDDNGYCSEISKGDISRLEDKFSEKFEGKIYPYESEDMMEAEVGEMILAVSKKINCFQVAEDKKMFLKNDIHLKHNTLVEKSMMKMLGVKVINEKDFSMKLKSFDLNLYCKL